MWTSVLLLAAGVAAWNAEGGTRIVNTVQGRVRGRLIAPNRHPGLRPVEVFLGLPYAAAPVSNLRFMPPVSPSPWNNLRFAETLGPVCPQNLPKLDEEARRLAPGRIAYLKRLLPFLKNQSEDCLHLNIYAPAQVLPVGPSRLAVMVFVHGESFHWNSGNPYDGSILASYADVIVVTVNYRLGILGFLRPGMDDSYSISSNLGLLDLIAALQWIKENIANFGGDPTSVTLVGHHTGAVLVNYLMLSPVVQPDKDGAGLFQRAILMSGSSLSEWASSVHPEQASVQVAEALNCPRHGDPLVQCLRRKRVSDLLAVRLARPLGPIVDGNVIPSNPANLMANYTDLFTRYDLLCGVTEAESYHLLDAESLARGLLDSKRDEILKEYFRETYQILPELAQAKATLFYSRESSGDNVWRRGSSGERARDATVALLSDARVVAPLVQTALYHSRPRHSHAKTYMYVFGHRSKYSEYHHAEKSVFGEELPYLFGIPLDGQSHHFNYNYNLAEKLLSEVVMTQWTNFAKTGNPNTPRKYNYLTMTKREWTQYDNIIWQEFEPQHRMYYYIDSPPKQNSSYRHKYLKFWNEDLPNILSNPSKADYSSGDASIMSPSEEDMRPRFYSGGFWQVPRTYHNIRSTMKPIYGLKKMMEEKKFDSRFRYPHISHRGREDDENMDGPNFDISKEKTGQTVQESYFALTVVIIVGICFLLINLGSLALVCYQKRRMNSSMDFGSPRYRAGSSPSMGNHEDRYSNKDSRNDVKSILKKGDSCDTLKLKDIKKSWPGIYRQTSSSTVTVDPHLKVSEWIVRESNNRGPSSSLSSKERLIDRDSDKMSCVTTPKLHHTNKKVKKVSVAVDATPSARSASVLKQTPIELTKSLDSLSRRRVRALHRSETVEDDNLCTKESDVSPQTLQPGGQSHDLESSIPRDEDVNVTSKDLNSSNARPRTPVEALDNIKRRNFPKVLPDFSESEHDIEKMRSDKRMSLPQFPGFQRDKKVPPPPPPRISTLGRRPTGRNTVPNFLNHYANELEGVSTNKAKEDDDDDSMSAEESGSSYDERETPPRELPGRPPGGVGAPVEVKPVRRTAPILASPERDSEPPS